MIAAGINVSKRWEVNSNGKLKGYWETNPSEGIDWRQ
jgi:hypothetical protein